MVQLTYGTADSARINLRPVHYFSLFSTGYTLLCSLIVNGNPIYVFPEKELRDLSPNFHIHVFVSRIVPHIFLQQNTVCRPIVWIYKSLTDTWMWKLGLRPRNSFTGNISFEFSVLYLCSVVSPPHTLARVMKFKIWFSQFVQSKLCITVIGRLWLAK